MRGRVLMLSVVFCLFVSGAFAVAQSTTAHAAPNHVYFPRFVRLAPEMAHTNGGAASGVSGGVGNRAASPRRNPEHQSSFDRIVRPILERRDAATTGAAPKHEGESAPLAESRNFGGLLVAPSYHAIPYTDPYDISLVTLGGDFNHDGSPDLLTLDYDGNISVLINDGKGHFASPLITNVNALTGKSLTLVAGVVADLNGDGYPDIVALDAKSSSLYLFHNHHDGTFDRYQKIALPANSEGTDGAFLVADVTGDGKADLVTVTGVYDPSAANTDITVQTIPGTGGGHFATAKAVQSTFTFAGYYVTVPNNGALLKTLNGKANLVLEAQAYDSSFLLAGVSVLALPSSGDGSFAATPSAEADFGASYGFVADNSGGLSLADLNNDGYPDITLSFGDDYLYSALGQADGTFGSPMVAENGFAINPTGWAVLDVNQDGYKDFVDYEQFYTAIWPGKGDGTFANPKYLYSTGSANTTVSGNYPGWNLAVADFNGDGLQDFAVVDSSPVSYNRASIFVSNGDGSFQAAPAVAPTDNRNLFPQALEAEAGLDLNGDGKPDVLFQSFMGSPPYPFIAGLSDGKGNFTYKQALAGNAGGLNFRTTYKVTGDFNGDGLADVVFGGSTGGFGHTKAYLAVALSNGDGTLKTPVPWDMGSVAIKGTPAEIAVGDVNGDGKLDIVAIYPGDNVTPSGFLVALGNGDGTFQQPTFTAAGNQDFALSVADFDGDGKLDLLLVDDGSYSDPSTANVSIVYGDGSGSFDPAKAQVVNSSYIMEDALVGDLNGDGKPDLVLLSEGLGTSDGNVYDSGEGALVYLNVGKRQFSQSAYYEQGREAATALLADFNGDGVLDLFYSEYSLLDANDNYYGSQVLLGNGDGTFGSPSNAQIPPATHNLMPGDYMQDGSVSMVANSEYAAVAFLLNQGGTSVALTSSSSAVLAGQAESISATVTATLGHRPTPTGTLVFTENGVAVGTASLNGGSAYFSIDSLPVGAHTLVVTYSGDGSFNVHQKAASVSFTVNSVPVVPPGISLTADAGSLSLKGGATGTVLLHVSANSTYSGTVSFAASGSYAGLNVQINPGSVTLAGGQSATVAVAVSASTLRSAVQPELLVGKAGAKGATALALLLGGLLLPAVRRKGLRALGIVLCAVAMLGGAAGLSGCGGDSNVKVAPKGTYTVVLTATPSVAGASVQTATITIAVQ